jgi:hypothetical protein
MTHGGWTWIWRVVAISVFLGASLLRFNAEGDPAGPLAALFVVAGVGWYCGWWGRTRP